MNVSSQKGWETPAGKYPLHNCQVTNGKRAESPNVFTGLCGFSVVWKGKASFFCEWNFVPAFSVSNNGLKQQQQKLPTENFYLKFLPRGHPDPIHPVLRTLLPLASLTFSSSSWKGSLKLRSFQEPRFGCFLYFKLSISAGQMYNRQFKVTCFTKLLSLLIWNTHFD